MRKKASRRTTSRKSITKPRERRTLEINKETIRTLAPDELTQVVTGVITCPNSGVTRSPTQDTSPTHTIEE